MAKKWECVACGDDVEVVDDYEPKYCCNDRDCGCGGYPVNPVFCDKCDEKIFGERGGK